MHWSSLNQHLCDQGWYFHPYFLNASELNDLFSEYHQRLATSGFRAAGIGHSGQHQPSVRGDQICWWDPSHLLPAEQALWQRLESWRQTLNRELFLNASFTEVHYAHYGPGQYYARHCDQIQRPAQPLQTERLVTFIIYLNQDWSARDEGWLRLYPAGAPAVDIEPKGGSLVTFFSSELEHEVLAPRRERLSMTGWHCRRF